MNARKKILEAIAGNKPDLVGAPISEVPDPAGANADLQLKFIAVLESIGGKAIVVSDWDIIRDKLNRERVLGKEIINTVPELGIDDQMKSSDNAKKLENVYLSCIPGQIGIAENGAIWVDEKNMINRLLPFICQHLIVVLDAKNIVGDMHQAYASVKIDKEGYGLFIAGPSKTADIEQSLVIGAHGARSLTVYLLSN